MTQSVMNVATPLTPRIASSNFDLKNSSQCDDLEIMDCNKLNDKLKEFISKEESKRPSADIGSTKDFDNGLDSSLDNSQHDQQSENDYRTGSFGFKRPEQQWPKKVGYLARENLLSVQPITGKSFSLDDD